MTLEQMTSMIEQRLRNGFRGSNVNHSYNLQQIEDDIHLMKNFIVTDRLKKGLIDISILTQSINCIELVCDDIAQCCNIQTGETYLKFTVPDLMNLDSILYVGTVNRQYPFKHGYNNQRIYNKYTPSGKEPYVWWSDFKTGWLFNPPTKNIKFISVEAVFKNPYDVFQYECCKLKPGEEPRYPVSDDIIKLIIDELVKQYVNDYRRLNMIIIPNNGQAQV
jgi:hypothetical protein